MNAKPSNTKIRIDEEPAQSKRQHVDALCTQESYFWHPEIGKGCVLVTSAAEKGKSKARNRGVSTVLSPRSCIALNSGENINACIITGSV